MADPTLEQQAGLLMSQTFALVQTCPAGRVTTYSWVGKVLGYARGARMIGWIMNEAKAPIPAQRVLNSKGELSGSWAFGPPDRMRSLLEAEGIIFTDDHVDLKRYGWNPLHDLASSELESLLEQARSTPYQPGSRLLSLLRNDVASPLRIPGTQNDLRS